MDLKQYRSKLIGSDDERAVSPVIGVILMVAITVILAAVIAAFVLDMGDLDDSAPNAQFEWESNDSGEATSVTHTSGDDIDVTKLSSTPDIDISSDVSDDTWSAGETVDISGGEASVTITWEGDSSSTIIAEFEG